MLRRLLLVVGMLGAALASCAMPFDPGSSLSPPGAPPPLEGGGGGGPGGAGSSGSSATPSSAGSTATSAPDAGVVIAPANELTAADWDDNLNFSLFLAYANAQAPSARAADRVVITVTDEAGAPLSNARVKVSDAAGTRLEAPTGSDGRLLFFPERDGAAGGASFTITVQPPVGAAGSPLVAPAPTGSAWSFAIPGSSAQLPGALDLAFVLDVTGSMGDEIEYLKREVEQIAAAVAASRPNVSVRYGLVVYRDVGDDFVTASYDFGELATFKTKLGLFSARGGGDYPEAVETALKVARGLSWREGNVARVAFLIADAPPHPDQAGAFLAEVDLWRAAGLRLYPVAASGVADEAEYLFRVAAQSTLGRYLFLTDDSGIGDGHAEPRIPCYQVQLLSKLMVRMIESELTGTRVPAAPADVLRRTGNPSGDTCTLSSGATARF